MGHSEEWDTSFLFARVKVPAREKPVARERSKKRRPRNECANDIVLHVFVLSRTDRFPLSCRVGERGSSRVDRVRGTAGTCCRRVLEGATDHYSETSNSFTTQPSQH